MQSLQARRRLPVLGRHSGATGKKSIFSSCNELDTNHER